MGRKPNVPDKAIAEVCSVLVKHGVSPGDQHILARLGRFQAADGRPNRQEIEALRTELDAAARELIRQRKA